MSMDPRVLELDRYWRGLYRQYLEAGDHAMAEALLDRHVPVQTIEERDSSARYARLMTAVKSIHSRVYRLKGAGNARWMADVGRIYREELDGAGADIGVRFTARDIRTLQWSDKFKTAFDKAEYLLKRAESKLARKANPPDIGVELGGDYEPTHDGWWFHGEAWMTLEGGEELRFVTDVYTPRDGVVEVYTQETSRPGSDKVPLDDWQIEALVMAVQDGAVEVGLR